jgi:hypothetical protein
MVVPKMATMASTCGPSRANAGTSPLSTFDQSTSMNASSITYAKIDRASQRRTSE